MSDINDEKRKRISVGLYSSCPASIKQAIDFSLTQGYHFIVTQLTHPSYTRHVQKKGEPQTIGRTDRVLQSNEWGRLIVGELSFVDVDSDIQHIRDHSKKILSQELGFASHLGIPAIWLSLTKPNNPQLARLVNEKLILSFSYSVWIHVPMLHPSRVSPIVDSGEDTWEWWNEFRTYCNYDKRLGLALELCTAQQIVLILSHIKCERLSVHGQQISVIRFLSHSAPPCEISRWIGEPVKAIVIPTSYFLENQYGKPVLSKIHQEILKKFMGLDVQYVIKVDSEGDISLYVRYLQFLGKKLYVHDIMNDFVHGFEDFLQNPLQPLTEHLETNIYEIFEKDQVKYDTYQNAIYKAIESFNSEQSGDGNPPVVMVVGAGRGPLVQAVVNIAYTLNKKVKIYAVEKNPYAINTLLDRVKNEWNNQVTLVSEDMRIYEPPEKADILVSELLGSFGDNELSPECLDGAQRFLKKSGICIPQSYTSYLAPLQSLKIHNEIRANRPADKTLQQCYETPYVAHLANFYQMAQPQPLFTFCHPNWSEEIDNQRYKKLRFQCEQSCILTGFVGYFDTVLYKDIMLSIHPDTHTPDMVSWFPIVFPLQEPIHIGEDGIVEVSFWRVDSEEKVWYEWCLHSPIKTSVMNPNGRAYFIRKH